MSVPLEESLATQRNAFYNIPSNHLCVDTISHQPLLNLPLDIFPSSEMSNEFTSNALHERQELTCMSPSDSVYHLDKAGAPGVQSHNRTAPSSFIASKLDKWGFSSFLWIALPIKKKFLLSDTKDLAREHYIFTLPPNASPATILATAAMRDLTPVAIRELGIRNFHSGQDRVWINECEPTQKTKSPNAFSASCTCEHESRAWT
ncbi:hypothetical protein BJ138DRAFT_1115884 [Hygrophoropsis aurantiaca]|uniref:Uncharacterized protein n=1 Tax=Hygrophoropsis aurantiaca TaxID=72124 RepID=A0ACB8A6W1_9AGAM|nr:hypothetical protein BJ138DRAFT_1115884 [Hygrophoropsis aurantiaca]